MSSKEESRILEMAQSNLNEPLDCWRQITFIIFPSPNGPSIFSFLMFVDTGLGDFRFIDGVDLNDVADVAEGKQSGTSRDFIIMADRSWNNQARKST